MKTISERLTNLLMGYIMMIFHSMRPRWVVLPWMIHEKRAFSNIIYLIGNLSLRMFLLLSLYWRLCISLITCLQISLIICLCLDITACESECWHRWNEVLGRQRFCSRRTHLHPNSWCYWWGWWWVFRIFSFLQKSKVIRLWCWYVPSTGIILSPCISISNEKPSMLLILDAKTFNPLAQAKVSQEIKVPLTFHGIYSKGY